MSKVGLQKNCEGCMSPHTQRPLSEAAGPDAGIGRLHSTVWRIAWRLNDAIRSDATRPGKQHGCQNNDSKQECSFHYSSFPEPR